jgi:hypothetical protein
MAPSRNDPCPCGSGEKYKKCCARAERSALSPAALVLALIVIIGGIAAVLAFMRAPDLGSAGGGRVWSEEHGHWHTTSGAEPAATPAAPVAQPPGPAPAGKVWSPEHGHWHDANRPPAQQ